MPVPKLCSMEMNGSVQENTPAEDAPESVSGQVKPTVCDNDVVKQEMAVALIAQGLSEEAVCRILHIDAELLPDNN